MIGDILVTEGHFAIAVYHEWSIIFDRTDLVRSRHLICTKIQATLQGDAPCAY